jgi:hypothetical protein
LFAGTAQGAVIRVFSGLYPRKTCPPNPLDQKENIRLK